MDNEIRYLITLIRENGGKAFYNKKRFICNKCVYMTAFLSKSNNFIFSVRYFNNCFLFKLINEEDYTEHSAYGVTAMDLSLNKLNEIEEAMFDSDVFDVSFQKVKRKTRLRAAYVHIFGRLSF